MCVCDEMSVSLCLCKRYGLLRDGAPTIIYHYRYINFFFLKSRRATAKSNRGPSAYQAYNALYYG